MRSILKILLKTKVLACLSTGMTVFFLLIACKREDTSIKEPNLPIKEPNTTKEPNLLLDVKHIMESIYFWADYARSRASVNYEDYSEQTVSTYVKALKSPEDRFTFILTTEQAITLQGKAKDAGLMLRYLSDTLWVAFVEKGSPAEEIGLVRGQWIQSLTLHDQNGIPQRLVTTPPPDPFTLNSLLQPTAEGSKRALRTGSLKGPIEVAERNNNEVRTLQLRTGPYEIQAVDTSRIITRANKKVGYIHFTTFTGELTNEDISEVLLDFHMKGVTDLIVDVRYNGGGLVFIAEHFLNAMYNPSRSAVMYQFSFNSAYSSENKAVHFSNNTEALNPTRIYFLIDASTASASELLINSLLPFFPSSTALYMVGRRSVGKNVGSYLYYLPLEKTMGPAVDSPTHAFLPICFSVTNESGAANYAEGFEPHYSVFDGLYYELGDEREAMLFAALYHIENDTWPTPSARTRRLTQSSQLLISSRSIDRLPSLLVEEPLRRK